MKINTPPPPSPSFLPRVYALQQIALKNPEKVFKENIKTVDRRY